jgi:hypothetical protein
MPDNKNIRDGRDRAKVAKGEDYEVRVLKDRVPKASNAQIEKAIKDGKNVRTKIYTLLDKYK